ncbi:MAG: hypothetical protein ACW98Y_20320, partial [Candidatus Thorarchaeota archaeon]
IGAERTLVVREADQDAQGRALGTYQLLMTSTGLVASPFGAFLWQLTGSLRSVYLFAGFECLVSTIILGLALDSMREPNEEPDHQ